jgi:hypothetical protein
MECHFCDEDVTDERYKQGSLILCLTCAELRIQFMCAALTGRAASMGPVGSAGLATQALKIADELLKIVVPGKDSESGG